MIFNFGKIALVLIIITSLLFTGCEAGKAATGSGKEPVVVRIMHNWPREMDTTFRDVITGEPSMGLEELNARIYAEDQVFKKYNVKFSWIQYTSNLREEILRSVLAGAPLAELVRIIDWSQGTLLGQNVLQELDDFAYLFDDEDSSWMLFGKVYGHYYFLNNVLRHGNDAPLCYNIGMLDKVPALRENGKTVLPVDLWFEGKWTWSVFEDYLQKVNDYWIQEWEGIAAYGADHTAAALMAIHSNGASVFGERGLEIGSARTKEAVAYIERLISGSLIKTIDIIPGTGRIAFRMDMHRFQWRQSVFCNLQQWAALWMTETFNERGDAVGIVPFPRPDHMEPDDPRYRQLNEAKDCYAVPRGVSKEMTELAIKAFREYTVSYYKKRANSDRALDYTQSNSSTRASALNMHLDITNEEYGQKLLDVWKFLGSNENVIVNEYAKNIGIWDVWSEDILSNSLYKVRGASGYAVQVDAQIGKVNEIVNNIQRSLDNNQFFDNIPPHFTDIEGAIIIFAAGSNKDNIDWGNYFSVYDNVDGEINASEVIADLSRVNFSKPGIYDHAGVFSAVDSSGNVGMIERTVIIFDPANKTPPALTIQKDFRSVRLDEKTEDINWRDDFIESATDKDGIDIKNSVFADLSEINTTVPGKYPVGLTVTDYAGNTAFREIIVSVDVE